MSQFCGSFCALSRRSLLTVILYCAPSGEAVSAAIDTPANAAQAKLRSRKPRCCMSDLLGSASWQALCCFGQEQFLGGRTLEHLPTCGEAPCGARDAPFGERCSATVFSRLRRSV